MNIPLRLFAILLAFALGLVHLDIPDAAAGELVIRAQAVRAPQGATVVVPIEVLGAAGMEGVQFVLTFDPTLLKQVDVGLGPLAGAGTVDVKVRRPGELRVAMFRRRHSSVTVPCCSRSSTCWAPPGRRRPSV